MEPLKIEKEDFLKCLLCDVSTPSKYELLQHIYRHLTYRKYQCSSCTELFYTEEEREVHCLERGHIHTYGMKVSAYCELYVSMLLRDSEYAFHNGSEAAVMQRSKANLGCNFDRASESSLTDVHNTVASFSHDQLLSSSFLIGFNCSFINLFIRFRFSRAVEEFLVSYNQKMSRGISDGDTTEATSKLTINLRDVPQSRTSVGVCQETFPWSRLPRGLQVKILQNLSRSDLDNCQLVNREMFGLIRCNERLMKRRVIEYMGIRCQSLLYLNCSEKGVSKVIDLKTYCTIRKASDPSRSTYQSASQPLWLHSLTTILHIVLKKADILHLEIDGGLTDTMMVAISLCLSNAGCRVHMLTISHLSAESVEQSMLLQFFHNITPSGICLLEPHAPRSLSQEVLFFIVGRKHFYLSCSDTIPINNYILAQLTATDFCIASPNEITYNGLISFAQRLASEKRNVIRGIIYSDYSYVFDQFSLEWMRDAGLKLISVKPYALVVSTKQLKTEERRHLDDLTNSSFIPCYL
ncbi:hypothetical protein GCK32_002699 [Trichostrongylus colubriformis]|uniref:F-box domain-containing protein n=1 Tax=Trichostrongylus colubriformis TaxID=6319 RepID=A0AAN8F1S9_TRICO